MRSPEHEGGIKLPDGNLYVTDPDIWTPHRAGPTAPKLPQVNDFQKKPYNSNQLAFSVAYTTNEFPPGLKAEKDIDLLGN